MFRHKMSPTKTAKHLEDYTANTKTEDLMEVIQHSDQFSEEEIFYIFWLLNIKVKYNYLENEMCLQLVEVIINYLTTVKPPIQIEELCTICLRGVGSKNPQMICKKLCDSKYDRCLPPRSLLMAVGELAPSQAGRIWQRLVLLLKMAQEEEDMLAMCHALCRLVTGVREHECGCEKAIFDNELSPRTELILHVIMSRWSLKRKYKVAEQVLVMFGNLFYVMSPSTLRNKVNRLIRWLTPLIPTEVTPFYISQCIWQLVDALALSGYAGMNLESKLENITGMLLDLLNKKVKPSEPISIENQKFALRAFLTLTKLYKEKVVSLLRKTMESFDPVRTPLAIEAIMYVFNEVPQTTKLRREVMNSTILVVQEDLRPVPKVLIYFIHLLSQHDYLSQPEANSILYYIARLSEPDPTNEEDIHIICSKILDTVSWPRLIDMACYPSDILDIVPLTKAATRKALKVLSMGEIPKLHDFDQMPFEVILPQRVLLQLMLFSQRPYRVKDLGASCLRLLLALHPVIHSNLGQLWNQEILQMLETLKDHSEENLSQKEWEDRLLQFLSQSLVAIDDDNWLQQLVRIVLVMIKSFRDDEDIGEKAFLYKFFGFSLRTSKNEQLIKMMLSAMFHTSQEELQDREGIAAALSVVSTRHLEMVLEEVRLYGAVLTDKDSSPILKYRKEHQQRKWVMVSSTIYLTYGKIILEDEGAIFDHLDGILALVLQHYQNCILEKDKNLQQDYLDALAILTNMLSSQQHLARGFSFPQKRSLINLMVELISKEPLDSISSPIRQKAMNVIANFRMLEPLLKVEEGLELLRLCFRSVFCPPPADVLQKDASSPEEAQAIADLLNSTMGSLQRLTEAVITESPTRIENCLELLYPWLNSQKDSERERAMQCAAHVLEFATTMDDFKREITQPGHWVKLLAVCCQDPVDKICSLSSQAAYHLYRILSRKKQMKKRKVSFWQEEDKSKGDLSPRNANDIGKEFARFFTRPQLTNLVLTAVKGLSSRRAQVSLASAKFMSGVIEEQGTDLEKVKEIAEGILQRLRSQLEPSTEEETLQAMCLLAGSHTRTVVPLLLNKPHPWDRTILALWKVFGTQRETTVKVLQLLSGVLEERNTGETREVVPQCVLAAWALYEMLSGSLCQNSIHKFFPRLLLAVLCHLHWVVDRQSSSEIFYTVNESPGEESKVFNAASCALEVLKLLVRAACGGVMAGTEEQKCWELLCNSELFYLGAIELTSVIVKNCGPALLKRLLNHIKKLLRSLDNTQKIPARIIYAELLCHESVAGTLGLDFVGNLSSWITEPDCVIKEIGLRGISNLALHPGKSETLKTLVPTLKELLNNDKWRVRLQAVKALQNITQHGRREDAKLLFRIAEHLCAVLSDEEEEVRISAASALRHMLRQVRNFKPRSALRKKINNFLMPLLLSLQDNNPDVAKACGRALTEWTNVMGWLPLTHILQDTDLSDHFHVLEETCKYLVNTCETQFLGDLLLQSFEFLASTQPFLRTAAVTFIASITVKINLQDIHEDDLHILQNKMEKQKQGLQQEEGKSDWNLLPQNAIKIGKEDPKAGRIICVDNCSRSGCAATSQECKDHPSPSPLEDEEVILNDMESDVTKNLNNWYSYVSYPDLVNSKV